MRINLAWAQHRNFSNPIDRSPKHSRAVFPRAPPRQVRQPCRPDRDRGRCHTGRHRRHGLRQTQDGHARRPGATGDPRRRGGRAGLQLGARGLAQPLLRRRRIRPNELLKGVRRRHDGPPVLRYRELVGSAPTGAGPRPACRASARWTDLRLAQAPDQIADKAMTAQRASASGA